MAVFNFAFSVFQSLRYRFWTFIGFIQRFHRPANLRKVGRPASGAIEDETKRLQYNQPPRE